MTNTTQPRPLQQQQQQQLQQRQDIVEVTDLSNDTLDKQTTAPAHTSSSSIPSSSQQPQQPQQPQSVARPGPTSRRPGPPSRRPVPSWVRADQLQPRQQPTVIQPGATINAAHRLNPVSIREQVRAVLRSNSAISARA